MNIKLNNEERLHRFIMYLNSEKSSDKTKVKHIENVEFFINEFLTYRLKVSCSEGINYVSDFFSDFFVNKCAWASKNAVKETITAVKKFYKFMVIEGYITKNEHKEFLTLVKNEKDSWIAGGYSNSGGFRNLEQILDNMMNENIYEDNLDMFDIDNDEFDKLVMENYYDDLNTVYSCIKKIVELKPWEWLPNDQLLAIREPEMYENFFTSVLGNQGGDKAIMIHEDYLGLNGFFMMYTKDGMTGHDIKINTHGYVINLFEERFLDEVSKKYIIDSKVKFNDKNLMPMIYDFEAGRLPVIVEPASFDMIAEVLEKAVLLFEANKEERETILETSMFEVYGYHGEKKCLTLSELEREIYRFNEELLELDELTLGRLNKTCKRTGTSWEIDSFYHSALIDLEDSSRPWFPSIFLVADPNSEEIIHSAITENPKFYKDFNQVFIDAIKREKVIPAIVYVPNQLMYTAFYDIAEALNIELKPMNSSELINDFKWGFTEQLENQ